VVLLLLPFLVLALDDFLCSVGVANTVLLHAGLRTLLELQAVYQVHLELLGQDVQFLIESLDLLLSLLGLLWSGSFLGFCLLELRRDVW